MISKIAIIGFGLYGRSIYDLLDKENLSTIGIISSHEIEENFNRISYSDLHEIQAVLITKPTKDIPEVITRLIGIKYSGIIVNFAKGITSQGLVSHLISRNKLNQQYVFMAAAAFANDIKKGSNVYFCISTGNSILYEDVVSIFSNRVQFDKYNNTDMAELVSALKNVYSIYMGIKSSEEISATDQVNHLMTCIKELKMIITELQCDRELLFTGAGIGDLILSGTNFQSRNFLQGYSFGKSNGRAKADRILVEGENTLSFIEEVMPRNILKKMTVMNYLKSLYKGHSLSESPSERRRVITYGTFDLFHHGHLELLRRARNRGDYLIVGLSTDEFNLIKGKQSVQTYEMRKQNLLALNFVDEVLPECSWNQKENDIISNNIDLFVIGSDWKGKFDHLEEFCQVEYLTRTEGISTTLLKKIQGYN